MIDIQIVDDHISVVKGLILVLNESGRVRVTEKYYDLKSCREGLIKGTPDVLLLDIALPDGDGVDFCAEIRKKYPEMKIVMLTGYKEFNIVKHALDNGAHGYILKNAEPEEIFEGIETVCSGEQFLCKEIDFLMKDKKETKAVVLTDREKEVLKYIAAGYTTKEIAELICRDTETVKFNRKNLFIKLKVKNMAELIKKGYEMKFI